MNSRAEAIIALVAMLVIVFSTGLLRRRSRTINVERFRERWNEAQKLCANKSTWPLAVINADKLLDEALKKRHFKGKTMGERLVSAQRELSSNDGVWYGHKLRNRLVHEDAARLRKREVKEALIGIRQALKDLGAL